MITMSERLKLIVVVWLCSSVNDLLRMTARVAGSVNVLSSVIVMLVLLLLLLLLLLFLFIICLYV